MESKRWRAGLIINPMAGLGGRVGLKGSDGPTIQQRALSLGAFPEAESRAVAALEPLRPLADRLEWITYPGEMGESALRACGLNPLVVGSIRSGATTGEDTRRAVREIIGAGARLLLFAGGDGTARDVHDALAHPHPVLGIPAGVKMHSAAFARTPATAGELARRFLAGGPMRLREVEVVDLDEEQLRDGLAAPRLYGVLSVPYEASLVQGAKAFGGGSDDAVQLEIGRRIVDQMEGGCVYAVGPGTTTRAIARCLGLPKTLIGVDLVADRKLLRADANEKQILEALRYRSAKIVIAPIGGQGCILGRGNQQLSAAVIRKVGRSNIIVAGTPAKIQALGGRPLWVDTGDPELDRMLSGYVRIIAGCGQDIIYRVE